MKKSRTMEGSVRPANCKCSVAFGTLNSIEQAWPKAFSPAPPVRMSVPSISNKTTRTMKVRKLQYFLLNFFRDSESSGDAVAGGVAICWAPSPPGGEGWGEEAVFSAA